MPVAEAEEVPLGVLDGFSMEEDEAPMEAVAPVGPLKSNKPIVGIIYPPPEVRSKFDI